MRDRIASLGMTESVHFLGAIPRNELTRRYRLAQLVVVPSIWPEPFGLVGLEAMSVGTPVVGSGRGGMSDWLTHGHNGLVADPTDTEAFAAAIEAVLTDGELRAILAANALETAQQLSR